jgi:hypothetical protein
VPEAGEAGLGGRSPGTELTALRLAQLAGATGAADYLDRAVRTGTRCSYRPPGGA